MGRRPGAMWGIVIFTVVYVIATIFLVPGSALTVGAGFVFGLGWGFLAVSLGSTTGAALRLPHRPIRGARENHVHRKEKRKLSSDRCRHRRAGREARFPAPP